MQRSACKDATPSPPLRKLLSAASSQNLATVRSASSLASSGGQLPGRHSDRCASYSSLDSTQNGADLGTAPASSQTSPSEGAGNGHAGDSEADGRRVGQGAAAESPWREKADDGQSPSATSSASTSRRSSVAEDEPLHGSLKLILRDIEVRAPATCPLKCKFQMHLVSMRPLTLPCTAANVSAAVEAHPQCSLQLMCVRAICHVSARSVCCSCACVKDTSRRLTSHRWPELSCNIRGISPRLCIQQQVIDSAPLRHA